MKIFLFLISLLHTAAAPLEQTSLLTLRSFVAPKAGGGNTPPPPPYSPLILEEWSTTTGALLQEWTAPCTLPGLSTETWTEGRLSPRYPWGDQAWFLCRNVPVNSSFSTSPAPVVYAYLTEDGTLGTWVEEPLYPNATNAVNIIPYSDEAQGLNVFYLLGGGTTANGPSSPAKAAQPRIRVDTGPGTPPDAQGALLTSMTGVTINQLRILNRTLYGTGLFGGSTGIPNPTIFQIGAEGVLPTGTRNPTTQIPNFPLVLSVWTDPFSGLWWRTGLNRTAYVALHNNADGSDQVFAVPPAASAGTLGGLSWTVLTVAQQSNTVYLTNSSHIVKNTLNGLQNGLPYQPVVQAPAGWRYLSAHARNPQIPTPTATATATATSSSSASASASATATATSSATSSPTASASATATPTSQSTMTPTATSSPSSSSSASSTATATRDPAASPSNTPSQTPTPSLTSTPSNGTIPGPVPNNAAAGNSPLSAGETAGISLGSVAAICVAGLLMIKFTPSLQRLYIRQFGASSKGMKKGTSFRSVVSSDVPITISHNPQVLVQQRLEQLKDMQKMISSKQLTEETASTPSTDRTKKEFLPTQSA